ncbi:MAG: ATP-binding cassette domain-containing protein [Chloroflexi bacterium]|nr:ATP-binding cassette domain-containing protein [Chloroflexota bacterium]
MHIELQNIHKSFGTVHANAGISLEIREGTIQGLLGENGAGKTTLAKILSGYQRMDSGNILIDHKPVSFGSPAEAIRAGIGMLHQDALDIPALDVLDNFMLGSDTSLFLSPRQAKLKLLDLCQRFGFALDPNTSVNKLTVGERQQLEIVRLLALGVRVMILDEPTTGISSPQKVLLFRTLHRLASEGISIIFVSHKLDEIEQLCSEVTVLRQGTVAGSVQSPFSTSELVMLMFGQQFSVSPRPGITLGEPLLELDDAAVSSYRLNVAHMNLSVRAGEVIGLAGLEGSGQQMLMRACAGITPLAHGKISIHNHDLTNRPYQEFLQLGVSFVPAARLEEGLLPGMTLKEHFALLNGSEFVINWRQAEEIAQRQISEYNVVGTPDTLVQSLSGGNQQRALLAMLRPELRLLILEHPTRGLDIGSSRWIWEHLLKRREQGTAILFTSTDLDELVEYSDRIVVFSSGIMSAPVDARQVSSESLGYMIGGKST